MNTRTIALIGLMAIMGVGLIMLVADLLTPAAPAARTQIAIAAQAIEPYTVVTQDMIRASEQLYVRDASERGAYPVDAVVGLMTTELISPGDWITGVNAKPIREVRFTEDLGLEVVTFQAGVDRLVGGELRPGHIVNLYGYGRDADNQPFTTLIEEQLWVVAVSAGGREVSDATPRPNIDTGVYAEEGGDRTQPATFITVAVEPDRAYHIIDSLGAQQLTAWVTLAASQISANALATPVPEMQTATPGLPLDLSLTATALWEQLRATPAPETGRTGDRGTR